MDIQSKLVALQKKVIELQARSKFQERGGDLQAWDSGLKDAILPQLTTNLDGDLDPASFDAAIALPGIERHMGQQEQPEPISLTLPDTLSVNGAWGALDAMRAAASPRR